MLSQLDSSLKFNPWMGWMEEAKKKKSKKEKKKKSKKKKARRRSSSSSTDEESRRKAKKRKRRRETSESDPDRKCDGNVSGKTDDDDRVMVSWHPSNLSTT
jgi:hypothetical protein